MPTIFCKGWQRNPDGEVDEQTTLPEPEEFYGQFVKPGRPVVFRNATSDAPAFSNWRKTNYLRDKYVYNGHKQRKPRSSRFYNLIIALKYF